MDDRSVYTDDYLRERVREGARQAVIFGAGFDSRALRLVASFSGEGSSLSMTYVHLNEQGVALLRPTQVPVERDYRRYGIKADKIEEYLEKRGFTGVCSLTIDQVRERYCPERSRLELAYSIVTARVKGSF